MGCRDRSCSRRRWCRATTSTFTTAVWRAMRAAPIAHDLGEVKRHTSDLITNLVGEVGRSRRDQLACRIFVRDQSGQIIYMGAFSYNGAWVNFGVRVAQRVLAGSFCNIAV